MKTLVGIIMMLSSLSTYTINSNSQDSSTDENKISKATLPIPTKGLCDAINSGCYTGLVGNCFMVRGENQYCM